MIKFNTKNLIYIMSDNGIEKIESTTKNNKPAFIVYSKNDSKTILLDDIYMDKIDFIYIINEKENIYCKTKVEDIIDNNLLNIKWEYFEEI